MASDLSQETSKHAQELIPPECGSFYRLTFIPQPPTVWKQESAYTTQPQKKTYVKKSEASPLTGGGGLVNCWRTAPCTKYTNSC
jgi:hypothetical protein